MLKPDVRHAYNVYHVKTQGAHFMCRGTISSAKLSIYRFYMCMYIYIYVCVYAYISTDLVYRVLISPARLSAIMHVYIYVCLQVHASLCMCTRGYTCTCVHQLTHGVMLIAPSATLAMLVTLETFFELSSQQQV